MYKRLLTVLFLTSAVLSGCEIDQTENKPEAKKYEVRFSTSALTQNLVTLSKLNSTSATGGKKISSVGDTLKNHANYLYYRIYNSEGSLINTVNQESSNPSFGLISDELSSGTYKVVFMASEQPMWVNEDHSSYLNSHAYPGNFWSDTFFDQFELVVGADKIEENIRLKRFVGAVEVNLKDAIPMNATKIEIAFNNDGGSYYYGVNQLSMQNLRRKDFQLTPVDIGQKDKKFLMHISNTSESSDVSIRAYSENRVIAEKIVKNVRCYKNQKTLLIGNLFNTGSITSAGFTVTVDPVWGAPADPINF